MTGAEFSELSQIPLHALHLSQPPSFWHPQFDPVTARETSMLPDNPICESPMLEVSTGRGNQFFLSVLLFLLHLRPFFATNCLTSLFPIAPLLPTPPNPPNCVCLLYYIFL
ncbi:hypothetical protein SLE2022_155860 [Rubroshorea leprosula]